MTTAPSERTPGGAKPAARRADSVMRVLPRVARLVADEPEKIADGVWIVRGGLTRAMNVAVPPSVP